MYPHVIRLRGPWECEPLARSGELPPPRRVTVPCRLHDAGLAGFTGPVRLTRRFGRPGQVDPSERLWLTFAGVGGDAQVLLNGQLLGRHAAADGPFEHDVTPILHERNVLDVVVASAMDDRDLCGAVAMEIRRTAHLRGVSSELLGSQLVARGEVVGTSERPLELYLLLDNRTVAYATILPAPEGQPFTLTSEVLEPEQQSAGPHAARVELIDGAIVWHVAERPLVTPA